MSRKHLFIYSVFDSDNNFMGCYSSLFLAKVNLRPGFYIIRKDSLCNIPDKKFVYGI